ncbi:MAG: hypothetical protein ACI82Z_000137 [Cellvibrionaceae bacterium]|jgi:hypothetical protein
MVLFLLFSSSIIAFIILLKSRNALAVPKGARLSIALLSLAFFVIGMEEISWV